MDGLIWWMSTILIIIAVLLALRPGEKANYGRYWRDKKSSYQGPPIPGRVAWLLQEFPALVVPLVLIVLGFEEKCDNIVNKIMIGLFILHYFHRSAIYPFLLKGAKPTPFMVFAMAFVFCAFNGYLQGRYFVQIATYPTHWMKTPNFIIGIVLFFLGMTINVHSDRILRNLRTPGETGYKIPKGGLFELVSGANYFGEIVEWWGLAIASWSYPSTAFAVFTSIFVGSRAVQHHRYYLENFKNYPKPRKAIIPFLL